MYCICKLRILFTWCVCSYNAQQTCNVHVHTCFWVLKPQVRGRVLSEEKESQVNEAWVRATSHQGRVRVQVLYEFNFKSKNTKRWIQTPPKKCPIPNFPLAILPTKLSFHGYGNCIVILCTCTCIIHIHTNFSKFYMRICSHCHSHCFCH